MTYVYTGGHDGKLSIYRNGELLSEHQYDVKIERRPTTDITATTATLNAELFSKSGMRLTVTTQSLVFRSMPSRNTLTREGFVS